MMNEGVQAWVEDLSIPTYAVAAPDRNPMFLDKRVYQGSSGAVYPYPVIERVADEKVERRWTALFLENRYLKIMVLPELGGRVQMAIDKTNGYPFIYYNRVIKPALVGLAGPWISGGIEFNWPQHHRPNSFGPVDWCIEEGADGSRTIWCSELEAMSNLRGLHGLRLYPERAILEVDIRLHNRTREPQTFLWWANPAVHAGESLQSVFPPDVHAVMDHGKRDVSSFPIATGVYYKVDYAPGTDISRPANIPVPTSYMAAASAFDFIGCYDHAAQAGMMHVANHHIVPGKKQWTWGTGDFGRAWDRQLTDEDGPYIELMCGAYTDNQPDFSWLMPGEEKRFTQVFLPYKEIGPAKNASQEVVVNLELEGGEAVIGVYVTRPRTVQVRLRYASTPVFETALALTPERAWRGRATVLESHALLRLGGQSGRHILRPQDVTLQIYDGDVLLSEFTPLPESRPPIPAPATAARPPQEIASVEELFLNGLHLEQVRHATYAPEPYYLEALRRDPLDSRCNNALGLLLYRRGRFAEAEPYFRTAVQSLTRRNPNPYDGEPFYNLGLALTMQGRRAEAFAAFYKAVWNAAWQDAGYFELARLAAGSGRLEEALDLVTRSLARNGLHHTARHLQIALLRRLGRRQAAGREIDLALELDPLEFGALWEAHLLDGDERFQRLARGNHALCTAVALDYAHAGLYDEAVELLLEGEAMATAAGARPDPLAHYYRGWIETLAGRPDAAHAAFRAAAGCAPDLCFPNRLEAVAALETAMSLLPADAHAPYLLGNFWYAHRRPSEAIACWERSAALDPAFPTVHRNLGLALFNERRDAEAALAAYERAFALDPTDARVFCELDALARRLNRSPQERLARLEARPDLVAARDDLALERIALLNWLGRPDEALALLMARTFHPWEGGEGKVTGQYVIAHVQTARRLLVEARAVDAVAHLEAAQVYPPCLGEGKLHGTQENAIFYFLGCAHAELGATEAAAAAFGRAAVGLSEPTSPLYYNDQPPDAIYYQGLARRRLGAEAAAQTIFRRLVDYGRSHMDDDVRMDYFAVSLPDFLIFEDDLNLRNRIHCHYMMALGHQGLGEGPQAEEHFAAVLALRADHLGAALHRTPPPHPPGRRHPPAGHNGR